MENKASKSIIKIRILGIRSELLLVIIIYKERGGLH